MERCPLKERRIPIRNPLLNAEKGVFQKVGVEKERPWGNRLSVVACIEN